MMLKSRMELEKEQDYSKILCTCGHELSEHDFPVGECLSKNQYLNIITGKWTNSNSCDCARFERDMNRNEDD